MARKLPKAPKKPKGRSRNSINAWRNYEQKLHSWKSRVSQIKHERAQVEAMKRKYAHTVLHVAHRGRRVA